MTTRQPIPNEDITTYLSVPVTRQTIRRLNQISTRYDNMPISQLLGTLVEEQVATEVEKLQPASWAEKYSKVSDSIKKALDFYVENHPDTLLFPITETTILYLAEEVDRLKAIEKAALSLYSGEILGEVDPRKKELWRLLGEPTREE